MRTAIEALFDAMVNDGADESSGDVEAPTGHFARLSIAPAEAREALDDYDDITAIYGVPSAEDITGHFLVITDSQGFIHIATYDTEAELIADYRALDAEYGEWVDDDETD